MNILVLVLVSLFFLKQLELSVSDTWQLIESPFNLTQNEAILHMFPSRYVKCKINMKVNNQNRSFFTCLWVIEYLEFPFFRMIISIFFNPILRGEGHSHPSAEPHDRGGSKYTQNLSYVITEHINLILGRNYFSTARESKLATVGRVADFLLCFWL